MLTQQMINYQRIAQAGSFYLGRGYNPIETPWMVAESSVRATLPVDSTPHRLENGRCLVGSAEQGFIELMFNGDLPKGRFQSSSPCFRFEREYNDLTRESFFKLELISYKPSDPVGELELMVNDAINCFISISDIPKFFVDNVDGGIDIFANGIELGSYGIRKHDDHLWVYGTGLAEPRFSVVAKQEVQS